MIDVSVVLGVVSVFAGVFLLVRAVGDSLTLYRRLTYGRELAGFHEHIWDVLTQEDRGSKQYAIYRCTACSRREMRQIVA